ncbi:MAG: hypothetical protein ABIB97_06110 [Patescibacteria group bacterium]
MSKRNVVIMASCLLVAIVAVVALQIQAADARPVRYGTCTTWGQIKTCWSDHPHSCCTEDKPDQAVGPPGG